MPEKKQCCSCCCQDKKEEKEMTLAELPVGTTATIVKVMPKIRGRKKFADGKRLMKAALNLIILTERYSLFHLFKTAMPKKYIRF